MVVEDYEVEKPVKPHGTKAKPRPTFAAPTRRQRRGAGKAAEVVEAVAEEPTAVVIETAPEAVATAPAEAVSEAPVAEDITTTEPAELAEGVEAEASDEKGAE